MIFYRYLKESDLDNFNKFQDIIKRDFLLFRNKKRRNVKRYTKSKKLFMLLAIKDKRLIGYQAFSINGKKGRLIGIAVLKQHRKKGIAKRLVSISLRKMKSKGVKKVISRTWETNIASQRLLEHFGFIKYRTVKNDRINGESSVWYKLILK